MVTMHIIQCSRRTLCRERFELLFNFKVELPYQGNRAMCAPKRYASSEFNNVEDSLFRHLEASESCHGGSQTKKRPISIGATTLEGE